MEGKLYGIQTKGCEMREEKPRGVFVGEEQIFKRKDLFNSGEWIVQSLVTQALSIFIRFFSDKIRPTNRIEQLLNITRAKTFYDRRLWVDRESAF